MSKQGSLLRIAKYKEAGNTKLLEKEEAFYKENYEEKKETIKKSK